MAGTSSRNFKIKKCVVKVVEEDNAFKEYHEVLEKVCDKDSLEHYGDKLYKTVEKFGVFQLAKFASFPFWGTMAGTSSRNFKIKKCVVKVVEEEDAVERYLDKVWDKDSLKKFGAKMYTSVEDLGVLEVAKVLEKVQPEPPRFCTFNFGDKEVGSYNFSGNPSIDDLQDRAMKAFKDATKNCEDEGMEQQFGIIRDYASLQKCVFRFFESMLDSGFIDEVEEIRQKIVLSVVVVHTFVIGVLVTAHNINAALKAFQHMSASGIAPISYSYAVLIKGLTADPNHCGDAKKFLLEMMDKGMRPNAVTYTAVIEGFAKLEDKAAEEEGKQLVEVMMHKGFVPNAKDMMQILKGRPTSLIRLVINIALSKLEG